MVVRSENQKDTRRAAFGAQTKTARLIEWNVDVLLKLLRHIKAARMVRGKEEEKDLQEPNDVYESSGQKILEEVQEIIELPRFSKRETKVMADPEIVELPSAVAEQLRDYVSVISSLYRQDNPFHNFEHASHGT